MHKYYRAFLGGVGVGWGGGGLTDRNLGVRGPHSFEGEDAGARWPRASERSLCRLRVGVGKGGRG